jgi:hypothetical protein
MNTTNLISILSILTNFTVLIVGVQLIRHLSRIEFKVEMLWKHFEKSIDKGL